MPATSTARDAYVPVPLSTLLPDAVTGFSLYVPREDQGPRLYRDASVAIEKEDLERLKARGVRELLLSADEHRSYGAYLHENLHVLLADEETPAIERFGILDNVVRNTMAQAFSNGETGVAVEAATSLASETVSFVTRVDENAGRLLEILNHDFHTFTHVANVSFYSVLLAREGGIESSTELEEIATGALLHDLGKLEVPHAILAKPAKLSAAEIEVVREHPTRGLLALRERDDVSWGQLMMVYQHHERMDGGGYPVGITSGEIHPWARICAVADVYEALTSERPYRRPDSKADALRILERSSGTALDSEWVERWKTVVSS